jgi:hypothetical protein
VPIVCRLCDVRASAGRFAQAPPRKIGRMSEYDQTDSDVADPEEQDTSAPTIEEQQADPQDDAWRDEDLADEARS